MGKIIELTDISGLRIIIEFLDVQIARVDVVEFVGLFVPRQTVRNADFFFQRHKLLLAGEAIKRSKTLLEYVSVNLWRNYSTTVIKLSRRWIKKEERRGEINSPIRMVPP